MADLQSDLGTMTIPNPRPRDRRGGTLIVVGVVVLVSLLIAGSYLAYPHLTPVLFKTDVASTEIAAFAPGPAQADLTASGFVVAQTKSKVGAKITARVASVFVKEGDPVKENQLLARLDDADLKSAIAVSQSRVFAAAARTRTARANVADLTQQLSRQRLLLVDDATPKAAIEDLEARRRALSEQVSASEAEVNAARSEVAQHQVNLQYTHIVSPIAGTVVTKPADVGDLVGPQTGPVAEVADFRTLLVEIDVPEARLHTVKVGAPCEIVLDAFGGKRHRGSTVEIGKQVNRVKATVTVKVKFDESMDSVLPGMLARVSFLAEPHSAPQVKVAPTRVVPASAVTERAGHQVVFIIDAGKARVRNVKIGDAAEGGLELLDGPATGTRVIANPATTLEDGQPVQAEK